MERGFQCTAGPPPTQPCTERSDAPRQEDIAINLARHPRTANLVQSSKFVRRNASTVRHLIHRALGFEGSRDQKTGQHHGVAGLPQGSHGRRCRRGHHDTSGPHTTGGWTTSSRARQGSRTLIAAIRRVGVHYWLLIAFGLRKYS